MPSRTHGRISILLFLVCWCFVVELVTHMVARWLFHFQFHLCISRQKEGRYRKAKAFPEILSRFPSHFTGQNCVTSPPWAARGAIKLSTSPPSLLAFTVQEDRKERVGGRNWVTYCPHSFSSIFVIVVGSLYSFLIYNFLPTLFDFSWP